MLSLKTFPYRRNEHVSLLVNVSAPLTPISTSNSDAISDNELIAYKELYVISSVVNHSIYVYQKTETFTNS